LLTKQVLYSTLILFGKAIQKTHKKVKRKAIYMRNKFSFNTGILVTTAIFALFGTLNSAHAQSLYWDPTGTTAGFGAFAGNWNGTTANWNSDSLGGSAGTLSSSTSASNGVIFAGGGNTGVVLVTGNQTVGSIDFVGTAIRAISLTEHDAPRATPTVSHDTGPPRAPSGRQALALQSTLLI
jgi:hypothetical protein